MREGKGFFKSIHLILILIYLGIGYFSDGRKYEGEWLKN